MSKNVTVIPPSEKKPDTLRVAAYCRVSSDSSDQLHSYASQIRKYTEEIGQHEGWELVDIYADEGLTGTRMEQREDFNRMMADCRKGRIDKVLVKSVSRFARNTKDCLAALRELMSLGVTVYFEKENINTETLTTELMVSVSGALAQQESISTSQNQRISYKRRMERGEFITCKAPYGYRIKDGKNLEIHEKEAAIIRLIFTRYLSGESTTEIAAALTDMGLRTRDGKEQWNTFAVSYILRNEKYIGDEGITGTSMKKRTEFNRMIAACKRGRIDMILTKSASRFARNTVDCLKVIRALKARGIAVIFEKENINTLTESSEFLITLFSSFSQAESESMSLNIIPGIRQSMKEGKIPFQYSRTLGYRRGPDGRPEIDPEEAETVRLIYARYLEGRSLGDIQRELVEKNIPTAAGIQGWSRQVIQNILTSEKYIGDGLRQKTYTTGPIGNKKTVKNNGELPMYYSRDHHPAIIPRDIYYRVKEEMARRASKRKVMQKSAKTEQGKYSARYALSELLVCGECGTPYKRCTWARNGKKRIVWRCVSRLEFGTKYCHNSPTLDEDRLHRAIVTALNEYGTIRNEVKADVLELAELARSGGEDSGMSLLELRQRLDALTAEQAALVDKILETKDDAELNAQLEMVTAEKQSVLDQIAACQQDAEQQAAQASRQREMEEWLDQQPMCFTEYDDTLTRRFVERITVVDAESIQVKIRDTDVVIDGKLC